MQRHSQKRQVILDHLYNTKSHPTAEWLYQEAKKTLPDLSLATIYRNLKQFEAVGLVKVVGNVDGKERYDADLSNHGHFICQDCYQIIDFELDNEQLLTNLTSLSTVKIKRSEVMLYGTCSECQ
jgi:Fur family peroxide stress response transcriptional regulator